MEPNGYSSHTTVSAIRYEAPVLSTEGSIEYSPHGLWTPVIDPENIAYHTLFKPFNLNHYLSPRLPIDMGWTDVSEWDDCKVNVLRMPLKFPGTPYRIPRELSALMPLIKRAAEYESFINKKHDRCFCHLTFDRSVVDAGLYHRYPGFHGDGIQGTKLTPKVTVEHSYILATKPPTEYCLQSFFLKHLDEAKHNYFLEFDKQAKECNMFGSLPNHLYLIDPYMVHRTPKIEEKTERIFARLTYAFTELQHPKNTINPLFLGQKYNKRVDIRENLCKFEFETPYNLYGLNKI
jgi:hypothetical protein